MAGRPKIQLETSAVYWEPKIKTYGFQGYTGLSLLEITVAAERIALIAEMLENPDHGEIRFNLALMQVRKNFTTRFIIIFDRKWEDRIRRHCEAAVLPEKGETVTLRSPVEVIYFFGPHYGDRYGIAETTFQVLAENDIRIVAAGFSGSAVYLVLPKTVWTKPKLFLTVPLRYQRTSNHEYRDETRQRLALPAV